MLRVGIVGLGRAATALLPSMLAHPQIRVTALAEPRPELRKAFCDDFGVAGYEHFEDLCSDPNVDVTYIATPHQFHCNHALVAIENGKHVLIEKPMALTLSECDRIIEAADSRGVLVMVGHTNGYDPPVMALRELAESERFGALHMINTFHYTDFLYRPRRPEELDTSNGGGIMYNQFPHQIDVVRTITNAPVASISAICGSWDKDRPTEASVAALVRFANGVSANIMYSGYSHLSTDAFYIGLDSAQGRAESLRASLEGLSAADEAEAKARSGYLAHRSEFMSTPRMSDAHERFGVVVCGFDHADVTTGPRGLRAFTDGPVVDIEVPFGLGGGRRASVFDELCAGVAGSSVIHDGRWGRATLAVCLAALESSSVGREVVLS